MVCVKLAGAWPLVIYIRNDKLDGQIHTKKQLTSK